MVPRLYVDIYLGRLYKIGLRRHADIWTVFTAVDARYRADADRTNEGRSDFLYADNDPYRRRDVRIDRCDSYLRRVLLLLERYRIRRLSIICHRRDVYGTFSFLFLYLVVCLFVCFVMVLFYFFGYSIFLFCFYYICFLLFTFYFFLLATFFFVCQIQDGNVWFLDFTSTYTLDVCGKSDYVVTPTSQPSAPPTMYVTAPTPTVSAANTPTMVTATKTMTSSGISILIATSMLLIAINVVLM